MISEKAAHGATFEEIKNDYPFLTDDDIRAALLYASKMEHGVYDFEELKFYLFMAD